MILLCMSRDVAAIFRVLQLIVRDRIQDCRSCREGVSYGHRDKRTVRCQHVDGELCVHSLVCVSTI